MVDVPKDTQHLLGQAQLYQQQMQGILSQKEVLNMQMMEMDKALKALEETKETEVFKIAGPILIKSGKADVKKDLAEKKSMISLRLENLEKGEKRIRGQLDELRSKLSKTM